MDSNTNAHTNAQVGFKRELIKEVRAFVADAQSFRRDWDASGPMVAGLDPLEAMDRLRKFQQMFEVRRLFVSSCRLLLAICCSRVST